MATEPVARPFRAGLIVSLVLACCLAGLFHRSLLRGEIFSPADLIYSFYPWAYSVERIEPTNPRRSDEAFYHQPQMATHWRTLKGGRLPDYDPLVLGGVPSFFQGLNVGLLFSPFSIPFYLAPADIAVTLAAPLKLLCAGLFMWVFLRNAPARAGRHEIDALVGSGFSRTETDALVGSGFSRTETGGLTDAAATAGAVAFALNGAFLVWLSAPMPTVALWMPLALLFVERIVLAPADPDVSRPAFGVAASAAALALTLGLAFTGAYLPTSLVLLFVTSGYAMWWIVMTRRWRRAPIVLAAVAGGLTAGAVALLPMFANLTSSPVAKRYVSGSVLPGSNVATLALPDFWGNPVDHTWWLPGEGNYPEWVTYLGVATIVLAGAGTARFGLRHRQPRVLFFAAVALLTLAYMYGVPPLSWLGTLPGLRQTNPFRFNVATALACAALAGYGVEALVRGPGLKAGTTARLKAGTTAKEERWWALGGALVAALALALAAGLPVRAWLPDIKARHLQNYEKAQLARFAIITATTLGMIAIAAVVRGPRAKTWRTMLAAAATGLIAIDLIGALGRFNPTLPRDRLYPRADALAFLQRETRGERVVPIEGAGLTQGHVWSVYDVPVITGFDFHGDTRYQQYLARAQHRPFTGARWEFVGLDAPALDLRLLGLLNGRFIATSPEDAALGGGGFTTTGELTAGRTVRQTFAARANGLRRVDVLTATFERDNAGTVEIAVRETGTGRVLGSKQVAAGAIRNLGWLTIDIPAQPRSARQPYAIELRGVQGEPGRSVTVMASAADAYHDGSLELNGAPDPRDLWFRTFASAPDRYAGATLVYSHDLNIYRNESAQPRAWFAGAIERVPRDAQLDRLADPAFDAARVALIDPAESFSPTQPIDGRASARVLAIDVADPDVRRFAVEAPAGGLLVISERAHPGWHARVDDRPVRVLTADYLLIALEIPPGARDILLEYRQPWVRIGMLLSALALAGIGAVMARSRSGLRRDRA